MISLADKLASQFARLTPFGKRDDSPLSNVKSAARWLDTLPVGDAFKCQEAIRHALQRFNDEASEYSKARLPVFMLLDEKSRDLQDTLVRQYLRNPRMSRQVENQLWHAIYALYWEIARGYHAFVLQLSHDAGKATRDDAIPLLTLRAIRAFGQLLKWYSIRYLKADARLWLRLHNLYRIAEAGGYKRQAQAAYADDAAAHSCESAYLHILMLDLADSGTLYPKQIDLLDRWLCNWHEMLRLDDRYSEDSHNFTVDLSSDHGARRVRKPDSGTPARYWDTHALLQRLDSLHADLQRGMAPADLGLTDAARTAESLELLEHLQHQWASLANREQRRAARTSVKRLVDVTHSLSALVHQIQAIEMPAAASPYNAGLDYHEADDVRVYGFVTQRTRERALHPGTLMQAASPEIERWVMHDESECGYGALVESRNKDWLRVGALIGIKTHDATVPWQLGIVRRLSRHDDDTSSVGIETLPDTPALAMLYDIAAPDYTVNGQDNTGASQPHIALWLAGAADSVILDPAHYVPRKVFQVHGVAGRTFVALGEVVERSEGWIRVLVDSVDA